MTAGHAGARPRGPEDLLRAGAGLRDGPFVRTVLAL